MSSSNSQKLLAAATSLLMIAALVSTVTAQTAKDTPPAANEQQKTATSNADNKNAEPPTQATALKAKVVKVVGNVEVTPVGSEKWRKVKLGEQLGAENIIRTGIASSCVLSYGKAAMVQVKSCSAVRLGDYLAKPEKTTIRLRLSYGRVRTGVGHARIKTDLSVATPIATLSVRGTISEHIYVPGGYYNVYLPDGGPADYLVDKFKRRLMEGDCCNQDLIELFLISHLKRRVTITGPTKDLDPQELKILALHGYGPTGNEPCGGANPEQRIHAQESFLKGIVNVPGVSIGGNHEYEPNYP